MADTFEDDPGVLPIEDEATTGPDAIGIEVPDEYLDMEHADSKIWLVKVPGFLLERWSQVQQDGVELGEVRVHDERTPQGDPKITVHVPPPDRKPGTSIAPQDDIPLDYVLSLQNKETRNTFAFGERDRDPSSLKPNNSESRGIKRSRSPEPNADRSASLAAIRARHMPRPVRLVGQIHHEASVSPLLTTASASAAYQKLVRARTTAATAPKRQVQRLDVGTAEGNMMAAGVGGGHSGRDRFAGFIRQAPKPSVSERAARMPKNELLDLIFELFGQQEWWNIKTLRAKLNQPESYLKEVLSTVADQAKRGPYAGSWSLKKELRSQRKEPGTSAAADGGDEEDDDDDDEDDDDEDFEEVG